MKKYFILLLGVILFTLNGCGKDNNTNILDNFIKNNEKKNVFLIKGTMDITSNEDTFTYNVEAARSKDLYRVNLTNTINNHEQVILKNAVEYESNGEAKARKVKDTLLTVQKEGNSYKFISHVINSYAD